MSAIAVFICSQIKQKTWYSPSWLLMYSWAVGCPSHLCVLPSEQETWLTLAAWRRRIQSPLWDHLEIQRIRVQNHIRGCCTNVCNWLGHIWTLLDFRSPCKLRTFERSDQTYVSFSGMTINPLLTCFNSAFGRPVWIAWHLRRHGHQ